MTAPSFAAFRAAILGRDCAVTRRESDWSFLFGRSAAEGCMIATGSWWRVICEGRIAYATDDDGQSFGLGSPIDGEERTRALLKGHRPSDISIDARTADLILQFEGGVRLDILGSSCGYESWQACFRAAGDDVTIVGGGGGSLSFVSTPIGSSPAVVHGRPLPIGWTSGG